MMLSLLALLLPVAVSAEDELDYIRFVEDGKDAGRLEAAIVTFRGPKGVLVHLVATVHVADRAYYKKLCRTFEGYDALLYEMVKPVGQEPRPGEKSSSLISTFQRALKDILDLEFQLDVVDYRKPNFVHADMDAETFQKLQRDRGESLLTLMLRAVLDDLNRQAKGESTAEISAFDLLRVLFSQDRARCMKLLLGRQFQNIESRMAGLEGKDGTVILTERNKVAFQTLKETLDSGKKEVGIFFGAAHMPDLARRIRSELKLEYQGTEWLTAWDIRPAKPAGGEKPERSF